MGAKNVIEENSVVAKLAAALGVEALVVRFGERAAHQFCALSPAGHAPHVRRPPRARTAARPTGRTGDDQRRRPARRVTGKARHVRLDDEQRLRDRKGEIARGRQPQEAHERVAFDRREQKRGAVNNAECDVLSRRT